MSDKTEKIIESIYKAFDEINASLLEDQHIPKSPETVLLGADGAIDSLGLTMLIVAIEQKIEEDFGVVVALVDENTMSEEDSPFKKVSQLAVHIERLMNEED